MPIEPQSLTLTSQALGITFEQFLSNLSKAQSITNRGEMQGSGIYQSGCLLYQKVGKLMFPHPLQFINIHKGT